MFVWVDAFLGDAGLSSFFSGFPSGEFFFVNGELGLMAFCDILFVEGGGGFPLGLDEALADGKLAECFFTDEGLHGFTAPGAFYDSDGDLKLGAEALGKVVADGGEGRGLARLSGFPFSWPVFLGVFFGDIPGDEDTEEWVLCFGIFFLTTVAPCDGPLHVGLTRGEPDFSDEDVLNDFFFVSGLDGEFAALSAGFEAFEIELPIAFGVGLGRVVLAGEVDLDGGIGISPAPDASGGVALEDHAI